MENKAAMWKVIAVIAIISILASFSFIYSVYKDVAQLMPRDSTAVDEIWKAAQTKEPSFATDD